MVIFHSYVSLPEGRCSIFCYHDQHACYSRPMGWFPSATSGSHRFDRPEGALAQPGPIFFFWQIKRSEIFAVSILFERFTPKFGCWNQRPSPCLLNLPISPQFLWTNLRCSLKPNSWKQICASYCGWTKSCTTLWRVYPIMYGVSCFPLVQDFVHPKYGMKNQNMKLPAIWSSPHVLPKPLPESSRLM